MTQLNSRHPLSCFLIGSESVLVHCAEILLRRGHDIRGILTDAAPIVQWASERNLETAPTEGNLARHLLGDFDYLFSIANLKVLPADVLRLPTRGAINFHDGPLPSYAGLNAPVWALLNGEAEHGITWHLMREKVDEGDRLVEKRFPIAPDDTALSLNAKCFAAAIEGFEELIVDIESGEIRPVRQSETGKHYFGRWRRPQGACSVDIAGSAIAVDALVRATDFGRYGNPFGAAKLIHRGRAVLIGRSLLRSDLPAASAGTIVAANDEGLTVATRDGSVLLSDLAHPRGRRLSTPEALALLGLRVGASVAAQEHFANRVTEIASELVKHEPFWRQRLAALDPLEIPFVRARARENDENSVRRLTIEIPETYQERARTAVDAAEVFVAGVLAYLARLADRGEFDVGFRDTSLRTLVAGLEEIASDWIPLRAVVEVDAPAGTALDGVCSAIRLTRERSTYLHDLIPRTPALRDRLELVAGQSLPVVVEVGTAERAGELPDGAAVRFLVDPARACIVIGWDAGALAMADAEAMGSELRRFLGAIREQDRLASVPIISEDDELRMRTDWNATQVASPAMCVHELVDTQAAETPEKLAVVAGEARTTYAALAAHAGQIARALRAMAVGRGDRVGICVERDANMVAAVLGVLKSGAAYVPLDPAFPADRLRFMVEDAQLAAVVTTSGLAETMPLPRDRQLLLDDDADRIARETTRLPANGDAPGAEDVAYVIYTSGSTGKPKGVMVPHRAVANFVASMQREPGLRSGDVLLAVTTLSFDIAVLELLLPLTVGATVVVAGRADVFDGETLVGLLRSHDVTVMQATPVSWRLLLASGWTPPAGFKALVGGEALPQAVAQGLVEAGIELWNMYGPTETTVWSTCGRIVDSNAITIGRPIANTSIWILDTRKQLCPVGVPGEIYIGGAGVTLGYWNRPELTAERFIPDMFDAGGTIYRTGDRGRWCNDGTIEHLGRLDDQVKVRGFRIELGEIEIVLQRHANVRQVVVIAREDVPGDKRLVAYVVAPDAPADLFDQLRAMARAAMPEYMVPSHFVRIEKVPLTPNGKCDRKALPAPAPEERRRGVGFVAPRTPTEKSISDIWASVLKRTEIGAEDNFFDLGGNSILLMEVVSRAQQLGLDIKPVTVFQYPTVGGLVEHLDGTNDQQLHHNVAVARAQKQRAALARHHLLSRGR